MPRTLRTLRSLAAGAALVLILASCGLIENLVPPQQVSDPLGLHGVPVTLDPTAAPAAGPQDATPQATTSYGASFGPGSVPDIDASGIPDWFDPDTFHVDVGIMSTVFLESAAAIDTSDFSDTIVLDALTLVDFAIADGEGEPRVELPSISTPAGTSVTLQKQSCSVVPPLTCTYEAQSGLAGFVIPVDMGFEATDDLYAILTGGSPTNTASGFLRLTATGTAPWDTRITVTIDAPSGTLDP